MIASRSFDTSPQSHVGRRPVSLEVPFPKRPHPRSLVLTFLFLKSKSHEVTAQKHVPQLTVEQVVHVLALRCAGKNVEIAHHVSQEGRSVRFDPTVVTIDILACGEGKTVQRGRGAGPSIMSREENCEILVAPVPHTILQEFMRTCIFGRVDVPTPQTHEETAEVAIDHPARVFKHLQICSC